MPFGEWARDERVSRGEGGIERSVQARGIGIPHEIVRKESISARLV